MTDFVLLVYTFGSTNQLSAVRFNCAKSAEAAGRWFIEQSSTIHALVVFDPAFDNHTDTAVEQNRDCHAGGRAMKQFLQFFKYDHLPSHLAMVAIPFTELAENLVETLPHNPESTVALRKLMEAKDCAVRAVLFKSES